MPSLAEKVGRAGAKAADLRAVVLPDFFLDHFVSLQSYPAFHDRAESIHGRGGGNLLTGPQSFRLGGNAANTAYALGRLGVPTTLVTKTDAFGKAVIEKSVEGLPVDTSCVQSAGRTSSTVALEFHEDGSNVMLSDPGPLVDLGPHDLDADEGRAWAHIAAADAVVVTNWSQTIENGTRLLEAVAARARERDAFVFLDTGDPTHRGQAAMSLLAPSVLQNVSAWGMNENELMFFARLVDPDVSGFHDAAKAVRRHFGGRLDVHTREEVFSLSGDGVERCGTYVLEPLRLTGSGDAWNAGNLLGELFDLETPERLCVANAVAALTITGSDGRPPTLEALVRFLEEPPLETRRVV